jgi:hypothetical protein
MVNPPRSPVLDGLARGIAAVERDREVTVVALVP